MTVITIGTIHTFHPSPAFNNMVYIEEFIYQQLASIPSCKQFYCLVYEVILYKINESKNGQQNLPVIIYYLNCFQSKTKQKLNEKMLNNPDVNNFFHQH